MTVANLSLFICLLLIINSVLCAPSGSNAEKGKQKEESDSSEGESDEKDLGTISPTEMEKLKEEIIEKQEEDAEKFNSDLTNSPEQIETFLEKEEEEKGEEVIEEVEKLLTDEGDLENFAHFLELYSKISSKASENGEEEEIKPISEEEMGKMKEELLELYNKDCEKTGRNKLSQDEFDEGWKKLQEKEGEKFPRHIERMIAHLKSLEEKEESVTSEKASEEESTEASTSVSETSEEELAPEEAFILRNAKDKICILAKFHCVITITFAGKTAEEKIEMSVPHNAEVKGKCGGSNRSPELQMSWENFVFTFFFDKVSEDSWGVKTIELNYDTAEPLFDGAATLEKVTAKSKEGDNFFVTPLGKSYFCPGQEAILLYNTDQHVATARIKEVHLQPYDVENGKFSTSHRCDKVVIGGDEEPFVQDETVPLAVGCTLALITLLILVGFSIHRAIQAAKVDYNEMP